MLSSPSTPRKICTRPSSPIKDAKVFVVGHRGLVRSAIVHHLLSPGFTSVVVHTRAKLDLTRSADLEAFFAAERLRYVV
jgi:GDP-L-fucose synthase